MISLAYAQAKPLGEINLHQTTNKIEMIHINGFKVQNKSIALV
jgi:hypothetical protein